MDKPYYETEPTVTQYPVYYLPEVEPAAQRPSLRQQIGMAVGAVSLITLAAVSVGYAEDIDRQHTAVSAEADALPDRDRILPSSSCTIPETVYGSSDARISANDSYYGHAASCADSYDGTIAVINFGVPQDMVQAITNDAEALLPALTDDIIRPDIEVLSASQAAMEVYDELTAGGCLPADDLTRTSAYAAASTMPETDSYDLVVGLGPIGLCSGRGGVAYDGGARLADVVPSGAGDPEAHQSNVKLFLHEVSHLYGLGHGGELRIPSVAQPGSTESLEFWQPDTGNPVLDIYGYLGNGYYYDEYGDGVTLMGAQMSDETESLSHHPLHQALLEQTARLAVGLPSRLASLNDGPVALTNANSSEVQAIVAEVPQTLSLVDPNDRTHDFDRLVLVPQTGQAEEPERIWGVQVVLADAWANYAELGTITSHALTDGVLTIKLPGCAVQLELDDSGNLTVSQINDD